MNKEKKRWEEVITSTHNRCKSWKNIRNLSNDPTTSNPPCLVSANQVAHQLLVNGRGTTPSKPRCSVLPPATEGDVSMVYILFQPRVQERNVVLKTIKPFAESLKVHRWRMAMLFFFQLVTFLSILKYIYIYI